MNAALAATTFGLLLACARLSAQAAASEPAIELHCSGRERVTIAVDGDLFTTWQAFPDPRMPVCYPLRLVGGIEVMRHHPFAEVPGEVRDHPHHRSLWFAHGDVNGIDFWANQRGGPQIRHDGFLLVPESDRSHAFAAAHTWLDGQLRPVCTDRRVVRAFAAREHDQRGIDHTIHWRASHGPLMIGDTKEGSFAVRMPQAFALRGKGATGRLIDSEGREGAAIWGKRARWIAYFALIRGERVGVALFDHPSNPRHPTYWHARDYGLAAANPFGVHDFERLSDRPGELRLDAGEQLTLRHAFLAFRGEPSRITIDAWYSAFAAAAAVAVLESASGSQSPQSSTQTQKSGSK
ncbi:MAG: PmoA family protein [Planctomycetota bacterium]